MSIGQYGVVIIYNNILLRITRKVLVCPKMMCSPGINGEGELRGQPANPGSPGKWLLNGVCVCVDNMVPRYSQNDDF